MKLIWFKAKRIPCKRRGQLPCLDWRYSSRADARPPAQLSLRVTPLGAERPQAAWRRRRGGMGAGPGGAARRRGGRVGPAAAAGPTRACVRAWGVRASVGLRAGQRMPQPNHQCPPSLPCETPYWCRLRRGVVGGVEWSGICGRAFLPSLACAYTRTQPVLACLRWANRSAPCLPAASCVVCGAWLLAGAGVWVGGGSQGSLGWCCCRLSAPPTHITPHPLPSAERPLCHRWPCPSPSPCCLQPPRAPLSPCCSRLSGA